MININNTSFNQIMFFFNYEIATKILKKVSIMPISSVVRFHFPFSI